MHHLSTNVSQERCRLSVGFRLAALCSLFCFLTLLGVIVVQPAGAAAPGWVAQGSQTTNTLIGVSFANSSAGWAVGVGGTIAHTGDGGTTWSTQASGTGLTLYGVNFISATQGWAVGDSGTILATGNGGATWTAQSSGTLNRLWGVKFTSSTNGCVVGYGGTILTTSNGGATWVPRDADTGEDLLDVSFAGSSLGWAVGRYGTVVYTDDGGATWTDTSPDTLEDLSGVSFINGTTGWAVGYAGTILRTIDAGANWTPQASGSANNLYGVCFRDASNGWVVGKSGTILHTSNGGVTWQAESSNTTTILYRVIFADATDGWAAGNSGTILATANGGYATPTLTISGVSAGWVSSPVSVTVTASVDASQTVSTVQYSLDAGLTWTEMPGSGAVRTLTIASEGISDLRLRASDSLGQTVSSSAAVKIDSRVPTITVAGNDAAWHRSPVSLTFYPAPGWSGAQYVDYQIGSGAWMQIPNVGGGYTTTISSNGENAISYRVTSIVGLTSATGLCTVKIDSVKPVAKAKKATLTKGRLGTLQLYVAKTPAGCGQAKVTLSFYQGKKLKKSFATGFLTVNTWTKFKWKCSLPAGSYTLKLSARDKVGNQQAAVSTAKVVVK